jgi:hypothetical protein
MLLAYRIRKKSLCITSNQLPDAMRLCIPHHPHKLLQQLQLRQPLNVPLQCLKQPLDWKDYCR